MASGGSGIHAELDGLRKTVKDIEALDPEMVEAVRQVLARGVGVIESDARRRAASGRYWVTRQLAASGVITGWAGKMSAGIDIKSTKSNAPWAFGAEFGARREVTRKRKAKTKYRGKAIDRGSFTVEGVSAKTGKATKRTRKKKGTTDLYKGYGWMPPWRGNQWDSGDGPPSAGVGYAVHPAIREHAEPLGEEILAELERVVAEVLG